MRGIVLRELDRWTEAEQDLQLALFYNNKNAEALNFLAYTWIERNEHLEDAVAMLKTAMQLIPNNSDIIDSYGWGLYKLGFLDEAILQLENAATLNPLDAVINDHLGDALWVSGRKREALYQWQRAYNSISDYDDDELRLSIERKIENSDSRPHLSSL